MAGSKGAQLLLTVPPSSPLQILELLLVSYRSLWLCSIFFQSFFLSLFFRLDHFYSSIFNFTNSFLWHFHSAIEFLFHFLIFKFHLLFSSKISILFFTPSISLPRLPVFLFVSRAVIIGCWNICIIAALKSLSYNFNTCVILVLSSVDCLFSRVEIFLYFCMLSNFVLHLDILNSMLWDSESYLNPVQHFDIFLAAVDLVRFRLQVLTHFWGLNQFSFQILRGTILRSIMTWVVFFLLIRFSDSLICWLGSDLYMQSPRMGPSVYKYLCVAFLNLFPKFFLVSWGFPFQSSDRKLEGWVPSSVMFFPDCLHPGPSYRRLMRKGIGAHSIPLGTRTPLIHTHTHKIPLSFGSCQLLL